MKSILMLELVVHESPVVIGCDEGPGAKQASLEGCAYQSYAYLLNKIIALCLMHNQNIWQFRFNGLTCKREDNQM